MRYKIIKPLRNSTRKNKKKMVTIKIDGREKTIHFGQKGYRHNYSREARKNYLKRSAGIRDKKGRLTKDNPESPNFWSRKILWGKKKR